MKGLLIWLWLSQGADVTTTAIALHRGCVERTYWSGNPAIIASGKLSATFVLSFGAPRMARGGKVLVSSFAAAATTAAVLNARTMGRCQ
jgi:hypothetical protein